MNSEHAALLEILSKYEEALLALGTFGWNSDPHPHAQCEQCQQAQYVL